MSEAEQFEANRRQLLTEWLAITIERFRANIRKLRIGSTQELYNSFLGELVGAAGGDEAKLRIAYAIQGMYTDMGVGRGMGAGVTKAQGADYRRLRNESGKLHRHARKAKRWQSKQLANEQHRLGVLLSTLTGNTLTATIKFPTAAVQVNL